jgi:hypothetical protein
MRQLDYCDVSMVRVGREEHQQLQRISSSTGAAVQGCFASVMSQLVPFDVTSACCGVAGRSNSSCSSSDYIHTAGCRRCFCCPDMSVAVQYDSRYATAALYIAPATDQGINWQIHAVLTSHGTRRCSLRADTDAAAAADDVM